MPSRPGYGDAGRQISRISADIAAQCWFRLGLAVFLDTPPLIYNVGPGEKHDRTRIQIAGRARLQPHSPARRSFRRPRDTADAVPQARADEKSWQKYKGYVKELCEGEKIEHFMQFVSLDTWGKQAEYIRSGMNFDLVIANVERFLTEVPYRNSLTFIITVSNLAIPNMRKLLEHVLALRQRHSKTYQRVWFDTPLLREPLWQSPVGMPDAYRWYLQQTVDWMSTQPETVDDRFNGFKDYEVQRLQRIVDQMTKDKQFANWVKSDFYNFFREHDVRRNTNFTDTFPEMSEWWDECKYWAENK